MTIVAQALEQLFVEKQLPVTKKEVDPDLVLYALDYTINPTHVLRMEMILPRDLERTDVQITYRYVTMLSRYEKRHDMLEVINNLNESKSAYYTFYLAPDGEVYAHTLVRVGEDVQTIYETMVNGPAVIHSVLNEFEKVAGVFSNV